MMETWGDFIRRIGRNNRTQQEEFYNRTARFMFSNKDILLNPGGMGLGKTLATSKVISDNIHKYEFFYIANPTAPLKQVWSKDLVDIKIDKHMIWFSKSEMCIKKKYNPLFNESKECNDDCPYVKDLWKNKEYLIYCEELLEQLKLPTIPEKYYKIFGESKCLLPVCRYGLKTRKVLIGDFFGVLNSEMFDLVTKHNEYSRNRRKACLIVDEAHLLPGRAKEYLSRTLSFDRAIRELEQEINCDYINRQNLKLLKPFKDTIETFKKVKQQLLNSITLKENTIRYSYNKFKEDYESNRVNLAFGFNEMIVQFANLSSKVYEADLNDYENEKEPYCSKFVRFLIRWKEKQDNKDYATYFQYSIRTKDNIKFFINCQDTASYLKSKLVMWGKVILNSGTISDLDYFKHHTGLESLDVSYMPLLKSYNIKDDVIIYPRGKFTATKNKDGTIPREITYKDNKKLLQSIIKKLSGRTIMFIQSKKDSKILEEQIKEIGIEVVNFCLNDDGHETSKTDFDFNMDKFNSLKNGVGLMNINGRVEGYNFQSEIDKSSVSNIFVYGYPFPKRGIIYEDELNYLIDILQDRTLASKWIDYVPTLDKIHQACMRAKRDEKDRPIIILWDNQFGIGEKGYNYMPEDLKGQIVKEDIQLLNLVIERDDKRKNTI